MSLVHHVFPQHRKQWAKRNGFTRARLDTNITCRAYTTLLAIQPVHPQHQAHQITGETQHFSCESRVAVVRGVSTLCNTADVRFIVAGQTSDGGPGDGSVCHPSPWKHPTNSRTRRCARVRPHQCAERSRCGLKLWYLVAGACTYTLTQRDVRQHPQTRCADWSISPTSPPSTH